MAKVMFQQWQWYRDRKHTWEKGIVQSVIAVTVGSETRKSRVDRTQSKSDNNEGKQDIYKMVHARHGYYNSETRNNIVASIEATHGRDHEGTALKN